MPTNAKKEVCTLQAMAESFFETALALKVYLTINPRNLQIESAHVACQEGYTRLMMALDTAYVELLGSGLDVEEVLPLVLLTEDYFKTLKKARNRKGLH